MKFFYRLKRRIRYKLGCLSFWLMIKTIKYYVNHHMDQFEVLKFQTDYRTIQNRTVYLTISYMSEYPDSHEEIK